MSGWFERLKGALDGRRVRPPPPPGMIEQVPDDDPSEPATSPDKRGAGGEEPMDLGGLEYRADRSASTSAFITYTKASGDESGRVITFRSMTGVYGVPKSILAWCHTRQQLRRFRIDRIGGMVCTVTGEELDPQRHCLDLYQHGVLKMDDPVLERVMRVVAFMARCDGEFHALEKEAISAITYRYALRLGGDESMIDRASAEAMRLAPSGDEFVRSLRYLTRAPLAREICGFTLDACAMIIDADGRHSSEEISWAMEVSDVLRRRAGRAR